MRKFLRSGRRRYALLLFVAAGSLVLLGNQCAPAPTKQPAPFPTGLSIVPTQHDFGNHLVNSTSQGVAFVVTFHGSGTTKSLEVAISPNFNGVDFAVANNTCQVPLAAGDQCVVDALFVPKTPGQKLGQLVARQLGAPAAGQAVATLTGNAV